MRKEYIRYASLIIIVILLLIFVYPTLYHYDKYNQKIPVRINRITGAADFLYPEGWSSATSSPDIKITSNASSTPLPAPTPVPTYNKETFQQYYDRVIKEIPDGGTAPNKNTLYLRWERARLGFVDKLIEPKDYFTIGSTKADVKKVMGPPTSINKYFDTWDYDSSSVTFENDKVKEYHDSLNKLLVR